MNKRLVQSGRFELWINLAFLFGVELGYPISVWFGPFDLTIWERRRFVNDDE